jgi:integrase
MKMKIKLYQPGNAVTSVYARLTYGGYELKFYPGISVKTEYWDPANQNVIRSAAFPEYKEINADLLKLQYIIPEAYSAIKRELKREPNPKELKAAIKKAWEPDPVIVEEPQPITPDNGFLEYFEEFTKRSMEGKRIAKGSATKATVYNTNKGFRTTLLHLKTFAGSWSRSMSFDNIDLDFYGDYINHLTTKANLSANTIGDHIKRIKAVLFEATAKGIKTNPAFTTNYFTKLSEETDSIYLNPMELAALYRLDLSGNKRLEAVRDLFLIGCYTGQRFGDWNKIRPEQIKNGLFDFTQQKTGNRVLLPVHPIVRQIFEKYDGKLPRPLSNQKVNEYLKEVCAMVAELQGMESRTSTKGGVEITISYHKWQLVTSHTARRSFATNEYEAGTPTITIKALTGHKTEAAFLKYIRLTPEEHAMKVLKLWDERLNNPKMRAV